MKARNIAGQAPGGRRTPLAKALPLATPYVIQIFPVYSCNFACKYCIFDTDRSKHGLISDKTVMDVGLFKKCVEDMKEFLGKVKVLRFVGIGEPLLHKRISEMIQAAASKSVANTIEMLTNASLLTPAMSDSLISAGLTRLVVSLQGTSREKYRQVCGRDVDFDGLVKNLKYFFEHKGGAQVYIKVVDCALDGEEDRKRFHEIFGEICDTIAVERAVPIHSGVDYKGIIAAGGPPMTQFGLPMGEVRICPQPFFTMQINPDGKVVPCYSFEYPGIMGDCNTQSVREIWDGPCFRRFRRSMLDGRQEAGEVCARCSIIDYRLFPEDVLTEEDAERLREKYGP